MQKSRNFWVNFINALLLTTELLGFDLGVTGDEIVGTFVSGNISLIIMTLLNLYNPIRKFITTKAWVGFDFLSSRNFWTNIVTFVMTSITLFTGTEIPLEGAEVISNTVVEGNWINIVIALVMNIGNFVLHDIEGKKSA